MTPLHIGLIVAAVVAVVVVLIIVLKPSKQKQVEKLMAEVIALQVAKKDKDTSVADAEYMKASGSFDLSSTTLPTGDDELDKLITALKAYKKALEEL